MIHKSIAILLLIIISYAHGISIGGSRINKKLFSSQLKRDSILDPEEYYKTQSGNYSISSSPQAYQTYYIDMPLDHFANNSITFKNRYWINTDYYKSNGPIILYNGGEDAVDDVAYILGNSTMSQLTARLNGILVCMEHRFYGTSAPAVSNFNYPDDILSKFTVEQALADMAYLLKNIKFQTHLRVPPVSKTKAILYGCSYSGNLAAWMRDKYSDLVFAAVASSAPVQAQYNFYEYFKPIIRYGSPYCIHSIQNVIRHIDTILFGRSREDVYQLKKMFGAEQLYDDDFASFLSLPVGDFWQYGIDSTKNSFQDEFCNKVFPPTRSNALKQHLNAYAKFTKPYVERTFCNGFSTLSSCLSSHNASEVEEQKRQNPSTTAWLWQSCTEFGYFQVAAPRNETTLVSRKLDIRLFERLCQLYFGHLGVPHQPAVGKVNAEYKGWHIQLDRVIWIDGEWDSWKELSVHNRNDKSDTFNDKRDVLSIIIPKATHCANVAAVRHNSPKYLKDVQDQQYKALSKWLNQNE